MVRISKYQLFCLILLFEIGTAAIFGLGLNAKQDAWLAVLIAALAGFILLWCYTQLQNNYPDKNLAEIIPAVLGKYFGPPLVLFYAMEFMYCSSRNLRDVGELIINTTLPQTPLAAVLILFMLAIFYILFKGLEVLARTSEIMMPVAVAFLLATFLMVAVSGKVDLKELQPVLANGIRPVLDAAFPVILTFPFGEMVVFLMYWNYLGPKNRIRKTSFLAAAVSGVLLIASTVIMTAVLGAYAPIAAIPLVQVIKEINISDILSNLDAIGVEIIFIGCFYKTVLFFFASVLTLKTLFKIKNVRWLIIPEGCFLVWFCMVSEPNYTYHVWLGLKYTTKYIFLPFEVAIPILLLLADRLKKKADSNASGGNKNAGNP
ncbi:MAG: GerAB/ArcD/ProY family transporter [Clostridiales bacterium]|jgi:spore germination protein KB|nr:GerAB/ArcD/ProY family transporter [Clostridiales bacterium]